LFTTTSWSPFSALSSSSELSNHPSSSYVASRTHHRLS